MRNEIIGKIAVYLHNNSPLNKAQIVSIMGTLRTGKQAQIMLDWLKTQELKDSLYTPIITKAEKIAEEN